MDVSKMAKTVRMIHRAAEERGWEIKFPLLPYSIMDVYPGDGKKYRLFSSLPEHSSAIGGRLASRKDIFFDMMRKNNVQIAEYTRYKNPQQAEQFMADYGPIVVKPAKGSHGDGIMMNVTDADTLHKAIKYASMHQPPRVILQKEFSGLDHRLLVVGDKMVAAMLRSPARVVGDGKKTVKELIDETNNSSMRDKSFEAPLSPIKHDRAEQYLGSKYHDVPADGETIQVSALGSVTQGGQTTDVTDDVAKEIADEAVKVAKLLGLRVCGVDVLTNDISDANAPYIILEANLTPGIRMHHFPSEGKSRDVAGAILDDLVLGQGRYDNEE